MAQQTLIKRYSNRRLYDTESSHYITMEDLAGRIRTGERVQVVDAATGEVITRRVLLQLVVLEGLGVADILPEDFLYTLIRLRNPATIEMFLRYLRMSMDAFQVGRSQMEDNLRRFEEQARLTAQMMAGFLPFFPQPGGPAPAAAPAPPFAAGGPDSAPPPDDDAPPRSPKERR